MSGGHFDYKQWHIEEIAREVEDILEEQKKPEPPTHKVHYVSIMKQVSPDAKTWVRHTCDTVKGAERYLKDAYSIVTKKGHFYDRYDSYTDKNGKEQPCEYFISEGEYDEFEEGHDECCYREKFSEETINEFKKGLKILWQASIYAQRIDWLLSGDDGEESFHERLKEELEELEKNDEKEE